MLSTPRTVRCIGNVSWPGQPFEGGISDVHFPVNGCKDLKLPYMSLKIGLAHYWLMPPTKHQLHIIADVPALSSVLALIALPAMVYFGFNPVIEKSHECYPRRHRYLCDKTALFLFGSFSTGTGIFRDEDVIKSSG